MCKKITAKRKSPRGNNPEDRDIPAILSRLAERFKAQDSDLEQLRNAFQADRAELKRRLDETAGELAEAQTALEEEKTRREKAETRCEAMETAMENARSALDPSRITGCGSPTRGSGETEAPELSDHPLPPPRSGLATRKTHGDAECPPSGNLTLDDGVPALRNPLEPHETAALDAIAAARGYPDRQTMVTAIVRRELTVQAPFSELLATGPAPVTEPSGTPGKERMPVVEGTPSAP